MTTATAEKESRVRIAPFAIEADGHSNADVKIQCVSGLVLRSRITSNRPVRKSRFTDETATPIDTYTALQAWPEVPGMELHVDPEHGTYEVIDPIYTDERMCERIHQAIRATMHVRSSDKVRGAEPRKGKLDVHYMKSLCREMLWLVEAGDARVCRGKAPDMADVEAMPGYFLLNPGAVIENSQPRYEHDLEAYKERLRSFS